MAAVQAAADAQGCALTVPDFSQLEVEPLAGLAGGDAALMRRFCYCGRAFETQLLGSYQPYNAALALEAARVLGARGWNVSAEAQVAGIAAAQWPGRFQVVGTSPLAIVDGGHNPQGAEALADSLADLLGSQGRGTVHFALGVLADKDYPAMVRAVAPWAASFSVYAPANPRALPADELAACIHAELAGAGRAGVVPVQACASPADAFAVARAFADPDGIAVAFGTLYAIADLVSAPGSR